MLLDSRRALSLCLPMRFHVCGTPSTVQPALHQTARLNATHTSAPPPSRALTVSSGTCCRTAAAGRHRRGPPAMKQGLRRHGNFNTAQRNDDGLLLPARQHRHPPSCRLPIRHRAVLQPVHRQVGALVGMSRSQRLVDVDAEARRLARMQVAIGEACRRAGTPRRSPPCAACIPGCRNWASTSSKCSAAAMHTGDRSVAPWQPVLHLVQIGQRRDPAQMSDAAGMHHGRADVVDQLLLDQLLAVPDAVEHFADRQRRRRVLADQPEDSWFSAGTASSIQNRR